jgi:anti-sigma28 factor (negative regulator of flagellin synthesis)
MKIERNQPLEVYRNNKQLNVTRNETSPKISKTDTCEFSHGVSTAAVIDKTLAGVKSAAINAVNAATDPARLDAIRKSLREGTYHIPTSELVKSILE